MIVATTWQTSAAVRVARRLTGRKCWLQVQSLSTAISRSGRRIVGTLSRSQVRRPVMPASPSALTGSAGSDDRGQPAVSTVTEVWAGRAARKRADATLRGSVREAGGGGGGGGAPPRGGSPPAPGGPPPPPGESGG